mgnify:CR=1 FL=1
MVKVVGQINLKNNKQYKTINKKTNKQKNNLKYKNEKTITFFSNIHRINLIFLFKIIHTTNRFNLFNYIHITNNLQTTYKLLTNNLQYVSQ